MRRNDREITDLETIKEMLRNAQACRVGMSTPEGEPYVVPLCPGYHEEEHALYFHGSAGGKKHAILRTNPRVCFEVEENLSVREGEQPCKWSMLYRSLIGFGTAEFLDSPEEKQRGLNIVVSHFTGAPADHVFPEEMLRRVELFRVPIERITGKENK